MPPNNPTVLAASIAIREIGVEAAGRSFTIPAQPAASWITALADDEPVTAVMPGMLSPDGFDRVGDLLLGEKLTLKDLRSMAFSAITEASGFRWWEAFKLVGLVNNNPIVMGEMTLAGIDPEAIPFGRWCTAVYAFCLRNHDEKEQQKWLAKFSFPPPLAEAMEEAAETGSFEDMVRGFRGMPGARG
jgi:hypothetical protein